jgi:hypothetical protein
MALHKEGPIALQTVVLGVLYFMAEETNARSVWELY